MLSRLALHLPSWSIISKNASLLFVTSGIYLLGLQFHEEVGTVLVVEGASMRPTLNPISESEDSSEQSDVCVLRKWRYIPRLGDVVCLNAPRRSGAVVKRIVALPGDIITPRDASPTRNPPVQVPFGHVWVEGDNSENSIDSNNYGPVPIGMLIGHVSHVILRKATDGSLPLLTPIPAMVPEPSRIISRPPYVPVPSL